MTIHNPLSALKPIKVLRAPDTLTYYLLESGLQCYAQSIMGMVDTQRVNVEAALAIAAATMGKITNCVLSHFNRLKKIKENYPLLPMFKTSI